MMNEGGQYNLTEIWQSPMNRRDEPAALRDAPFGGLSMTQFTDSNISAPNGNRDPALPIHARPHGSSGSRKRRKKPAEDDPAKVVLTTNADGTNDGDGKTEAESAAEQEKQPPEPPKDYIHVRARRGQATDSHSLAERARREKISERMKILQNIVPGCNKVIGKALVLDEIINYIQSLQHQVEFLSMKIEAVNSITNPNIEVFPPKEASWYNSISFM